MDYKAARKRAFWLLSMKNYHSEVLFQKLVEKGCTETVAELVLDDCKRLGFLSDKDAILCELRRGLGPRAIEFKLRLKRGEARKWISREMEKERIQEFLKKGGDRQKAYRTLQRKGFDCDLLVEVFSCRD